MSIAHDIPFDAGLGPLPGPPVPPAAGDRPKCGCNPRRPVNPWSNRLRNPVAAATACAKLFFLKEWPAIFVREQSNFDAVARL